MELAAGYALDALCNAVAGGDLSLLGVPADLTEYCPGLVTYHALIMIFGWLTLPCPSVEWIGLVLPAFYLPQGYHMYAAVASEAARLQLMTAVGDVYLHLSVEGHQVHMTGGGRSGGVYIPNLRAADCTQVAYVVASDLQYEVGDTDAEVLVDAQLADVYLSVFVNQGTLYLVIYATPNAPINAKVFKHYGVVKHLGSLHDTYPAKYFHAKRGY